MNLPLFPSRPSCTLCPLHTFVTKPGLPARWAEWTLPPSIETPAVLYIGQNPGQKEDEQGLVFIGPTGKLARLAFIGDNHKGNPVGPGINTRATVYLTNTARCGTWGSLVPSKKQYKTCSPFLIEDIKLILPTCSSLSVMLMGGPAIHHFYQEMTGKGLAVTAALNRSGEQIELPGDPHRRRVSVFSTYHPAFVLRKNTMMTACTDHLALLRNHLDGLSAMPSSPSFIDPISPSEYLKLCRAKSSDPFPTPGTSELPTGS